ncbi:MAG: hypothetical protein GOV15_03980 [Candidatus Diapherotrites archaeon]|nr:hypothetical protein [Candidatus Diapherotrites archaeon]
MPKKPVKKRIKTPFEKRIRTIEVPPGADAEIIKTTKHVNTGKVMIPKDFVFRTAHPDELRPQVFEGKPGDLHSEWDLDSNEPVGSLFLKINDHCAEHGLMAEIDNKASKVRFYKALRAFEEDFGKENE